MIVWYFHLLFGFCATVPKAIESNKVLHLLEKVSDAGTCLSLVPLEQGVIINNSS